MKTICAHIDFHILYILLFMLPLALLLAAIHPSLSWSWLVPAILPQGRVFTRTCIDFRSMKRPVLGYLLVNETLILLAVAAYFTIRHV